MNNHCVFYRTELKYDGRICALIRTLSSAYPNDQIFLYEYPLNNEIFIDFPNNVKIIKSNLLFSKSRTSHFLQQIKSIIYAINSLVFLVRKKPKTIQIHSEVLILGPLIYKFFFKMNVLLYDDKELYHPHDKNIPISLYKLEYLMIKKSDIVIITNEFRKKALIYIHKNEIKKYLIIDNFVFEPEGKEVRQDIKDKTIKLKENGRRILIHQGTINKARGSDLLMKIVNNLPEDWILCFIGISYLAFDEFSKFLNPETKVKIYNLGFIDYFELNSFYKLADASVIFYNASTFNNKFCAPNRLYSAVNNGLPIIVNVDNYTLNSFIDKKKTGITLKNEKSIHDFFENFDEYKKRAAYLKGKYEYKSIIPELFDYYRNQ